MSVDGGGRSPFAMVGSGAVAGLAARMITLGAALAATLLGVRLLPIGQYGVLAAGLAIIGIGGALSLLGLGPAVVREVAAARAKGVDAEAESLANSVASVVLITGMLGSLVLFAALAFTGGNVPRAVLAVLGVGLALLLFGRSATAMVASFSRGMGRMSLFAVVAPMSLVLQVLALLLLLLFGFRSLTAVGLAYGVVGVVSVLAAMILIRRTVVGRSGWFRFAPGEAWRLMIFAGPYALASAAAQVIRNLDVVVLAATHPSAVVGAYQPALRVTESLLLFAPLLVATGFAPLATSLYVRQQTSEFDALYRVTTKLVIAVSIPFVVVLAAIPDTVLTLLLGTQVHSSATVVHILVVGYTVNIAFGANVPALIAVGDRRGLARVTFIAFLVMLVLAATLIPAFGAIGAASATSVSVCALNFGVAWALYKHSGVHPLHPDIVGLLLTATVPIVLAWLFSQQVASAIAQLLFVALVSLAWWGVLLLTRMVRWREIRMLLPSRAPVGDADPAVEQP